MGWARLGRTLRTVGSPLSSYGRRGLIDTGEWNYDRFGARPDGIMPQGIKLLAFGVSLFWDSLDAQTFYNGEFDPGSG